jgi:DNA-binding HxlR family transcriptional regulator
MIKLKPKSLTQECFDDLERVGILAKTGGYKPGRDGKPQPVYALTELGKDKEAAARALASLYWLEEEPEGGPQ